MPRDADVLIYCAPSFFQGLTRLILEEAAVRDPSGGFS
jgi:hypothetical protein